MLVFLIILGFRATLHHNHKFPTFLSLLTAAVLTHSVERWPAEREVAY